MYVTAFCQFYHSCSVSTLACCHVSLLTTTPVSKDSSLLQIVPQASPEQNLMLDQQMQGTGYSLKALKLQTSRPNSMREKLCQYVTGVLLRHDNSYRLPNHKLHSGRTVLIRPTEQPQQHVRPSVLICPCHYIFLSHLQLSGRLFLFVGVPPFLAYSILRIAKLHSFFRLFFVTVSPNTQNHMPSHYNTLENLMVSIL